MPNKEAEATKLRVVQPEAHLEEELDLEISSRHPIAYRCLCGSRMERSKLVGEAVELLNDGSAAESKVPRSIHENRAGVAAKNFDFSCHRRFNRDRARRSFSKSLRDQFKATFRSSRQWPTFAWLHDSVGVSLPRTVAIVLHSNAENLSGPSNELIASNPQSSASVQAGIHLRASFRLPDSFEVRKFWKPAWLSC